MSPFCQRGSQWVFFVPRGRQIAIVTNAVSDREADSPRALGTVLMSGVAVAVVSGSCCCFLLFGRLGLIVFEGCVFVLLCVWLDCL